MAQPLALVGGKVLETEDTPLHATLYVESGEISVEKTPDPGTSQALLLERLRRQRLERIAQTMLGVLERPHALLADATLGVERVAALHALIDDGLARLGEDDPARAAPPTAAELFAAVRRNYFRMYWHYTYFNVARYTYGQLDAIAKEGGEQAYVEILAKPGVRKPRTDVVRDHPAQSTDASDDPAPDAERSAA